MAAKVWREERSMMFTHRRLQKEWRWEFWVMWWRWGCCLLTRHWSK